MRTLAQTGRLQEATHELDRYTWHVVGFYEVRWRNLGEHPTEKGHLLYYSGELDSHTKGVGFLVNKNIKNSVLGCRPVSSRLISICPRAAPFSITIVQAYATTTHYDDDQVEEFYNHLQEVLDKVDKDILTIQGDWHAKVSTDKVGTDKVGTDKVGTDKIGTDKVGTDKVGTDKVRTDKVGTDKVGTDKVGTDKVGTDKVGTDKVGTDKVGTDKVGTDLLTNWKNNRGRSCNATSNERGLRLLELTSYNDMVLANILGEHKAPRRWT